MEINPALITALFCPVCRRYNNSAHAAATDAIASEEFVNCVDWRGKAMPIPIYLPVRVHCFFSRLTAAVCTPVTLHHGVKVDYLI